MIMEKERKPKLLFFQWVDEWLSEFVREHGRQHVRCLEEFFDVAVIDRPCDYREVCDRYQPDVALFESGVYVGKRGITNASAYPEIPKLGLCNSDAYCESREVFISDMASWGINTFFTHSVSMGEYTPEIAGDLFVWPNFIDADLYRDYGEFKVIPVLFTGSQASNYPWRNRVCKLVSPCFPSLVCPHFGWSGSRWTERTITGERYARMLNASLVVPACGTIAKDVVRKHFEIPASRACLVAEKTPSLEAAGFVDFENCVFADETNIVDKLDYLFRHPDELQRITDAGYSLAHTRHTAKQRDQIFQWFRLYKSLKADQRIVQTSPFEPLVVVDKARQINNTHVISGGLDRVILRQGDEKLWAGEYREAELLYLRCLNYQQYIPEPKLRLALCYLYQGKAAQAFQWVGQTISAVVERYGARDPDPVEWAYLILCLLCQDSLPEARKRADQFPWLHHPELDRMRFAVHLLTGDAAGTENNTERRYSLHQLPERSLEQWIDYVCVLLKANQQERLAEKLRHAFSANASARGASELGRKVTAEPADRRVPLATDAGHYPATRLGLGLDPYHVKVGSWVTEKMKAMLCRPLHGLERAFGYFLPYRYSRMKIDEFLAAVRRLAREADVKTALLIGASAGEGTTEAFIAGILENRNQPTVFCANTLSPRFNKLQQRYAGHFSVKCVSLGQIQQADEIHCFGLVLIDGSELADEVEYPAIQGARFVLLDDINGHRNYTYHRNLLADCSYRLLAQNPSHRHGYAIFEKFIQPPYSLLATGGLAPAKEAENA